jgi:hypothetical protein
MIFRFPQLRSPVYNQIFAPLPKIAQMSAENAKFVMKNLFDVEGWACVVTRDRRWNRNRPHDCTNFR